MGLRDSIRTFFQEHPRAKKALGVATAIASNFTMIVTGSSLLAAAAGTIVDHRQNQERIDPDQLMDFFKKAIQEPEVQDAIKDAVREGGVEMATHISTAMNQLGMHSPDTGQFVSTMKSELSVIAQEIGIIRDMISYYEIPDAKERVINVWRLPAYLDDVLVIDDERRNVIETAIKYVRNGDNVAILGAPGLGKTTMMYAIWNRLTEDTDTALVWDTKDVSKVHERFGVVLFCDDLPETRELTRAIVKKDVKGIVTTAREQDWSRLPLEVRECFKTVSLPSLNHEVMREITAKHLRSQSVEWDNDALETIVENAQGSPIYVRYMTEEIGAEYRAGFLTKLIKNRAIRAPKGMTDYVAGILARVLFNLSGTIYTPKEGALPVIKTLLCLADMPNYETHEVHLNQMFFATKLPTDGAGPFNAIKQYLSRDPRFFSLKFMHDTLADVLRGAVDHPIVGDIRMVAQEIGAAGRKRLETQTLEDGWMHVKEEYDIDPVGGLEPLLAYAYFTAKNFGVDKIDQLAIELANSHIENPISQGLFAITGPLEETTRGKESEIIESEKSSIEDLEEIVEKTEDQSKPAETSDITQMIHEKIEQALGSKTGEGIISSLENLSEIDSAGSALRALRDIGPEIRKAMEGQEKPKDSFETLDELLQQESASPRRLRRRLRKAATKTKILGSKGQIQDKEKIGGLLEDAARRLVLLDSTMYLEILEEISEGFDEVFGSTQAADTLTDITQEIAVSMLDEKSRNGIAEIYLKGAKRSDKLSDYEGMLAYFDGKWKLLGLDSKDLTYISNQIARLMHLGRAPFSFEVLRKCFSLFTEDQIENRLGMGLQAFKDMEKALATEKSELDDTMKAATKLLDNLIQDLTKQKLLVNNLKAADLCTTSVSSAVSMVDILIKKSGKVVAADAIYPMLHEIVKPLVMKAVDSLKEISIEKAFKAIHKSINKMRGESEHKSEMLTMIESLM